MNPFPPSGNIIMSFFEYQGQLCVHLWDFRLMTTSDGISWHQFGRLMPRIQNWIEIDNYMFFYLDDGITLIGPDKDDLRLYRLPKENLVGRAITSIRRFNDDLVITTSNGIFYKNFYQVMNDRILVTN